MSSTIKSYISQWFSGKSSEISGPHEKFRICFCGKTSSESVEWYLIEVSVEKACLSEKTESSIKKLTPISVAKHFPSVYYAALGDRIYSLGGQRRSEGGGITLLKDVLILDLKSCDGFSAHSPAALAHWKPAPAVSGEDQGMKSVLVENLEPALVEDECDDEDWKSARADWKSGSANSLKDMRYKILRMLMNFKSKVEDWKPALRGKDWNSGTVSGEEDWRAQFLRPALRGEGWNSGTVCGEDQDMKSLRPEYLKYDAQAHRQPALRYLADFNSAFTEALVGGERKTSISALALASEDWKPLRKVGWNSRSISAVSLTDWNTDWNSEDWITDWKPDTGKALSLTDRNTDWNSGFKEALLLRNIMNLLTLRGMDWNSRSISALSLTDWNTDWNSEDWKPDTGKSLRDVDWNSRSISALSLTVWNKDALLLRNLMKSLTLGSGKPVSGKELSGVDWKHGPPMTFARCNPHTMVVDHKLYVIGGWKPNQKQADGWIECFDPEEKKWESLPSPPEIIHSSVMLSGLLKAKKEIIIARQRWDHHPILFYSYNITTRCWNMLVSPESKVSVCLPPNIGRAVTVDNTLYWISTEEHNHECIIRSYDLDRNMWFEDCLNTATIFGRREHFSSIYSSGPGFLHLCDQKFCLLLQSTISKNDPQSSIQYLYCVILDISPIDEDENEDSGKFELTTLSVQKYSLDHYINFLDCMLVSSD